MNRYAKFSVATGVAGTILVCALLLWKSGHESGSDRTAGTPTESKSAVTRTPLSKPAVASGGMPSEVSMQAKPTGKVKLGDEFWGANSQELVDWLNRRGFPSQEILQNRARAFYPNLNTVDGYPPDSVVYAEHLAKSDSSRRDEAIAHLTGAAVSGSTYALEALGRVYEDGPNRSIVEAEAYFKAAEYMGDWGVGLAPRKWTLTHEQNLVSSMLAQQIRLRINRTRQQAGLPPLAPDVKPGLDEFTDAMMAEYRSKPK